MTTEDVAMSDAKPAKEVGKAEKAEEVAADVPTLVRPSSVPSPVVCSPSRAHALPPAPAQLKLNAALLEKAVSSKESRFAVRGLRQTLALRKRFTADALTAFVKVPLPAATPHPQLAHTRQSRTRGACVR